MKRTHPPLDPDDQEFHRWIEESESAEAATAHSTVAKRQQVKLEIGNSHSPETSEPLSLCIGRALAWTLFCAILLGAWIGIFAILSFVGRSFSAVE